MDTQTVVKTTTHQVTYLGYPATVVTEHHDKGKLGLRTITTIWGAQGSGPKNGNHPAGTTVQSTVKGDGRTDKFEVIVASHVI